MKHKSSPKAAIESIPPLKSNNSLALNLAMNLHEFIEENANSNESAILEDFLAKHISDSNAARRQARRETQFNSDDVIEFLQSQDRRRFAENRLQPMGDFN